MALRFQLVSEAGPKGRIPLIDELKGFAMLLVILYHSGGVLGWDNYLHGETGVDIFLIISGFTLTRSATILPAKKFLLRRLLRIFPAYWLALATYILLAQKFFGAHISSGNIWAHIFAVHGFDLVHKGYFSGINDSFWFISLILLLYLVFLRLRRKLHDLSHVIATGALLTAAATMIYLRADHAGGVSQFATRIPSFFIGLVAGQLSRPQISEIRLSAGLAVGLVALAYVGFISGVVPYYAFSAPALMIGYYIVRRSFARHPDGRFVLRGIEWIGIYSYEIFLFHQPLIRDYNRLFWSRYLHVSVVSHGYMVLGFFLALGLTCAIAYVVHRGTDFIFASRPPRVLPIALHAH